MGFKNSKEVLERLNSPDNIIIHEHQIGKTKGAKNIPLGIKKVIAEVANETSPNEAAAAFGISTREARLLRNGETSSGPNEELKAHVEGKKLDAADKAIEIVLSALEIIPDKLKGAKLRDLSAVAKDMSQVHENLRKKGALEGGNISFHLHAPPTKELADYEVVDVEG